MTTTSKRRPTPDEIADMADAGEDIEQFFTNDFEVVRANSKLIPVFLELPVVQQLDLVAMELKLSRQDLIDHLLGQHRHQHPLAADVPVDTPESTPAVAA